MSSPPTIAIVHASVGSGHRIAAESVAAELRTLAPDARIELLDILSLGSFQISGDRATTAFTGPTAPFYNAIWGNAGFGRVFMSLSGPLLGLVYRRYATWLSDLRPSVIVSTHGLAASLSVRATRKGELARVPVAAAATDFGLHGFWPHHGLDLFWSPTSPSARSSSAEARPTPTSESPASRCGRSSPRRSMSPPSASGSGSRPTAEWCSPSPARPSRVPTSASRHPWPSPFRPSHPSRAPPSRS